MPPSYHEHESGPHPGIEARNMGATMRVPCATKLRSEPLRNLARCHSHQPPDSSLRRLAPTRLGRLSTAGHLHTAIADRGTWHARYSGIASEDRGLKQGCERATVHIPARPRWHIAYPVRPPLTCVWRSVAESRIRSAFDRTDAPREPPPFTRIRYLLLPRRQRDICMDGLRTLRVRHG